MNEFEIAAELPNTYKELLNRRKIHNVFLRHVEDCGIPEGCFCDNFFICKKCDRLNFKEIYLTRDKNMTSFRCVFCGLKI